MTTRTKARQITLDVEHPALTYLPGRHRRTAETMDAYTGSPRVCGILEGDQDETLGLVNPDEIVAPQDTITVRYDYPLSRAATFTHTRPGGFTRRQLCEVMAADYRRIYREEDEAERTGPFDARPPYGIWGHGIGDLYLEGVEEVEPGVYAPVMGS